MCRFCELVEGERDLAQVLEDPESAAERRRRSQQSWERLMDEIARADGARGLGE